MINNSNMFENWLTGQRMKTINPVHGCRFGCYGEKCWASQMAKRLQGAGVKGYENGFEPKFCPRFLDGSYKEGDIVFVGSMGDISWFPGWVWERIIKELIETNPQAIFFLETKNPQRYKDFLHSMPQNVILSTTIETNREEYELSKAPSVRNRYEAMRDIDWHRKHLSIEPVVKFDQDIFLHWIEEIRPIAVSIGLDNYNCGLPNPSLSVVLALIEKLEGFTRVEIKKSIRQRINSENTKVTRDRATGHENAVLA